MTVLNGDGLVGRVVQAGPTTSTVVLLSDPASAAGARLEGGNEIGVVNGVGESGRLVRFRLLDSTARDHRGQPDRQLRLPAWRAVRAGGADRGDRAGRVDAGRADQGRLRAAVRGSDRARRGRRRGAGARQDPARRRAARPSPSARGAREMGRNAIFVLVAAMVVQVMLVNRCRCRGRPRLIWCCWPWSGARWSAGPGRGP